MTPRLLLVLTLACLYGSACAARGPWQNGVSSWYGPGYAGKPTASGEPFRPSHRTAAHRTLPFGTKLLVTTEDGKRRVRVTINDRGPFVAGRTLDLSRRAARRLQGIDAGVFPVRFRVVGCNPRYAERNPRTGCKR